MNNANMANTPFKGTLKLDEVSLSAAQKFLNTAALEGTDAVISGSTNLSNANGKMSANGSLKLKKAVIHGVQVGYPITADFDSDRRFDTTICCRSESARSSWDPRRSR